MCNYCEDGELIYNLEDEGGGTGIAVQGNMLKVMFSFHSYGNVKTSMLADTQTFIKYCPMCGKELVGKFNIGAVVRLNEFKASINGTPKKLIGKDLVIVDYAEDMVVVRELGDCPSLLPRYHFFPSALMLVREQG